MISIFFKINNFLSTKEVSIIYSNESFIQKVDNSDRILQHLIDLKEDGSFQLNLSYFNFSGRSITTNRRFHRLFGAKPRDPRTRISQRDMDLAASVQHVTEKILLRMARHIHDQTGFSDLCLAGGVAQNSTANRRILRDSPFDRIWIQPAAGNAGTALGVACCPTLRSTGK